MRWLRNIIEGANVLNMLLVMIILAFAASIAVSAFRMRHYYTVPKMKAKTPPSFASEQAETPPKMPSDYAVIGEANLFHPDRTIPVEKKAEVPRPEIVLYATIINSDRLAFIEDVKNPLGTPGRGTRQRVVKKGEVVSGYTVTDNPGSGGRPDHRYAFRTEAQRRRYRAASGTTGPGTRAKNPGRPARSPDTSYPTTRQRRNRRSDQMPRLPAPYPSEKPQDQDQTSRHLRPEDSRPRDDRPRNNPGNKNFLR
jgi:hypothetical protein